MKYLASMLTMALAAGLVQLALAGDCCQRCGCQCQCKRVTCKIVCETKKVKDVFYACECEDFCLPGPGCKECACREGCAQHAEQPCETSCGCVSRFCKKHCMDFIYKPKYCHVLHRKVLKKYECEREVPVYKCVVCDLCPGCCSQVDTCDGEGMEAPHTPPEGDRPMPPKLPSARRGGVLNVRTGQNR
jgi:hypothetical protein